MAKKIQSQSIRNSVVMYMAKLMESSPGSRPKYHSLPEIDFSKKKIYSEEDLEDFKALVSDGLLYKFWGQSGGWSKQALLVGSEPDYSSAKARRMSDVLNSVRLSFGNDVVTLFEVIYQICADHLPEDGVRNGLLEKLKNIDQDDSMRVLTYWMFESCEPVMSFNFKYVGCPEARQEVLETVCADNLMLNLHFGPRLNTEVDSVEKIQKFVEGPMAKLLPWWLGAILSHWEASEPKMWDLSYEEHSRVRARQVQFLANWVIAIHNTEWNHYLEPFIVFFKNMERFYIQDESVLKSKKFARYTPKRAWSRSVEEPEVSASLLSDGVILLVNHYYDDSRIMERQTLRDLVAEFMSVFRNIGSITLNAIQENIIDREPYETFMVDRNAHYGIMPLDQRIESASKTLRGTIG